MPVQAVFSCLNCFLSGLVLVLQWEPAARQALECGEEGCAVPVYAMTPPPVGGSKGIARPSFKEVRGSIWRAQNTAKSWFIAKSGEAVPPKVSF